MTQNRRPAVPSFETAIGDHARQLRELSRGPGAWLYVGTYPGDPDTTPESPPFQNGWQNVGGGFPPLSCYLDKWQRVHWRGGIAGGAVGTIITIVPVIYRPGKSERFICASDTATPAVVQIDPDGTLTQVS